MQWNENKKCYLHMRICRCWCVFTVTNVSNCPLRASVSAGAMWRVPLVTNVNLSTGTCLLTLLMDAPVRYTHAHTHTHIYVWCGE